MIEENLGEAVRRLRESKGMSLRTLAENTGFSPSFISQVENGQASPSISSMERIARALGITLGQFFSTTERDTPIIVESDKRHTIESGWSKAKIEALGPIGALSKLEPVMVTIAPGGTSGKHPYAPVSDEFAIVFKGELVLTLQREGVDSRQTLREGDAATIRAGTPRQWENQSAGPAQIIVVSAHAGR